MKILAIETSTDACSAALSLDGEIDIIFEIAPQQHSQLILQQCDYLLKKAGLLPSQMDAIAFGRGPGSFTGLRIAAGVTQGIAFANDLPVIAISTLAAQAQKICQQYPNHTILSTIDARMKEIYWGAFELSNNILQAKGVEQVNTASVIARSKTLTGANKLIGIGSGWEAHSITLAAALPNCHISETLLNIRPSAKEIAILAIEEFHRNNVLSADKAIPVYLRNNVAKKSKRHSLPQPQRKP